MDWHTPTGPLVHEHRVIERMIRLMSAELDRVRESRAPDTRFIDAATDFIHTYADRCHHGKEEHILFQALAEKDLSPPDAQAMQELIDDHVRGRAMTARLASATAACAGGDAEAVSTIESLMGQLVEFYPAHIEKEDHHFFRVCLGYLSDEEQARMLAEYDDFDRSLIHEKYLSVVEALESASA